MLIELFRLLNSRFPGVAFRLKFREEHGKPHVYISVSHRDEQFPVSSGTAIIEDEDTEDYLIRQCVKIFNSLVESKRECIARQVATTKEVYDAKRLEFAEIEQAYFRAKQEMEGSPIHVTTHDVEELLKAVIPVSNEAP